MTPAGTAGRGPATRALGRPDLPLVLRTGVGLAVTIVGASGFGAAVVALVLLVLSPVGERVHGSARAALLLVAAGCFVGSAAIGVARGALLQRRVLRWVLAGREPGAGEAREVLALPAALGLLTGGLWGTSALLLGTVALLESGPGIAGRVVSSVAIGGLATAGLTFQLVLLAARPLTTRVLRVHDPEALLAGSLLGRLVRTWSLTVGVQLLGALELLVDPASTRQRLGVSFVLAVALVTGGLSTVLVARSVGRPMRRLAAALRDIGDGRLDVEVPVDDPGEVGVLQAGVRQMLEGLRERERLQDLFGRHVGPAVAREALRTGVALGGERRSAAVLFVDVTGSTALAGQVEPERLVALLNGFFTAVVDAVEAEGGLVNKFAGDGALCVFGAPVGLDDPAGAALRAGRRIRDALRGAGALDAGLGISAGEVVAGQVGARSRLEYTVIGDPVNEAARLTELAKRHPARALAAGPAVAAASAAARGGWRREADQVLRGRSAATEVWALEG